MLPFHVYDVFTDRPFAGNPLAIVEEADGLSDAQMQTIAREFNLSETIFIQTPDDPAHTAKVRIFTPMRELPFAGHPTVGCALHLAAKAPGTETVTLEERAGLVPVTITGGGDSTHAEFVAPLLPEPSSAPVERGLAAAAVGLGEEALGPLVPQAFSAGPDFFYIELADLDALARARVSEPVYSELSRTVGTGGIYLFVADGEGFRARMYAPEFGIVEDPATGSASAILAGPLHAAGRLAEGRTVMPLLQGVEMGRPSAITLTAVVRDGALAEVRIGGGAVPISSGRIRVPA